MKRLLPHIALLTAALAAVGTLAPASADELTERRELLLAEMRAVAEKTTVEFDSGAGRPQLVKNPVFRYDDQPRGFIDATMWAWTDAGLPVAFQKVEASIDGVTGAPKWGYCFASVSENRLRVQWQDGKTFRSTEAGAAFRPHPEAPRVADRSAARRLQVRELSRDFSARILLNPRTNSTEEMRLLARPIYEYDDPPGQYRGAAFGYSTGGRNPDLLILVEARQADGVLRWHYAPVRLTIGGVTIKLDGKSVWEVPFIEPRPQDMPTWTFFYEPRNPLEGEGDAAP